MKINHSFQINSLLKMIPPPPLLAELFFGGENQKVKNDHKSFYFVFRCSVIYIYVHGFISDVKLPT